MRQEKKVGFQTAHFLHPVCFAMIGKIYTFATEFNMLSSFLHVCHAALNGFIVTAAEVTPSLFVSLFLFLYCNLQNSLLHNNTKNVLGTQQLPGHEGYGSGSW